MCVSISKQPIKCTMSIDKKNWQLNKTIINI